MAPVAPVMLSELITEPVERVVASEAGETWIDNLTALSVELAPWPERSDLSAQMHSGHRLPSLGESHLQPGPGPPADPLAEAP